MSESSERVKTIVLEAIERHSPEAWPALLDKACEGDTNLRGRVERLLRAQLDIGSFHELARPLAAKFDPPIAERPGTVIGHYKLLEQIGEGGMGIVFMAEQEQPVRRRVALKVIKPGMDSRQVIARFEAERQALALMDHVNIARVLDGGATNTGRPYFVMELVHGVSITKYCDDNQLTPRERLELFVPVCQAIQHAHQKGVIHRDIKPSNVMVTLYDGRPFPKVIDFGVAKAMEQKLTERTLFTQYGNLIGTLEYMSPEQAEMSALGVDTRSDIYSLGALLYELLTGSTPLSTKQMKESAYAEILRLIKEEEPPKPSTRLSQSGEALASISALRNMEPAKLSKLLRGDLDRIVMKTLEKDRSRRYDTASGLAADVGRFLTDEPVLACPPSASYRIGKFVRRNKRILAGGAVALMVLITSTVVSSWQAVRAELARKNEAEQRKAAQRAQASAEASSHAMENALADLHTSQGLTANDPRLATLWFAHAARLSRHDPERERANRERIVTWSREAITPVRALSDPGQMLSQMTFHPGSRHLLTLSKQRRCTVWDLEQERTLGWIDVKLAISCAAWSPNGRWLAWGTPSGEIDIRSFPDGELIQRIPHGGPVQSLAFSPDGSLLASASEVVRIWDCKKGLFTGAEALHPQPVLALTFHPSGDRLATACLDSHARVFEISDSGLTALFPPVAHHPFDGRDLSVLTPLWVDRGHGLLTAARRELFEWRDARSGTLISSLKQHATNAIVCDADGRLVGCGADFAGSILELERPHIRSRPLPHSHYAMSVALSPDGTTLLTGCTDRMARLWSVTDGKPLYPPLDHGAAVQLVAYSPDGRLIATAQQKGIVRVWRLPQGNARRHVQTLFEEHLFNNTDWQDRLSMQGDQMVISGMRYAQVDSIASGKPLGPILVPGGDITSIALAPDGKTAALLSVSTLPRDADRDYRDYISLMLSDTPSNDNLQLWDWRTAQRLQDPIALPNRPHDVAFTPDGKHVLVICKNGEILLINTEDGRLAMRLEHKKEPAEGVADLFWATTHAFWIRGGVRFVADGSSFVTSGLDKNVRVWETSTGQQRYAPLKHRVAAWAADISADGRWLLTTSHDETARVWDLQTGLSAGPPLVHPDWAIGGCFHPNGRLVLTACRDGTARLWDWSTGLLVGTPMVPSDPNTSYGDSAVAFNKDGRLAVASSCGFLRIWDWKTAKLVAPPFPFAHRVNEIRLAPDGRRLVAAANGIMVVDLPESTDGDDWDVDDLCSNAELLSGSRIQEDTAILLTSEEWLDRWRAFRRKHPSYPPLTVVDQATSERRVRTARAISLRNRAIVNLPAKQYEEALAILRESLDLNPDDPVAQMSAAQILDKLAAQLATASDFESQDASRAVSLAEECVNLEPIAAYWKTLGIARYRAGKYNSAIDALQESERLQPGTFLRLTGLFLAMAHAKLGREQEARKWYDQAVASMATNGTDDEDLRHFRAEAEEVLKITRQVPPEDIAPPSKP